MDSRSAAEIIAAHGDGIKNEWLGLLRAECDTETLQVLESEPFATQMSGMLQAVGAALEGEDYEDTQRSSFRHAAELMDEQANRLMERGASAREAAYFISSLKHALLDYLQEESGEETIKVGRLFDNLAVATFARYAKTREERAAQQSHALLELSTPVAKLWEGIILVPLIGIVDTARAQQITDRLLETVVETESTVVIVDISGVPVIDTRVARHLMDTLSATKMLGAETIITGISPETAMTLTGLRVSLEGFRTKGLLSAGLVEALTLVGKQVVPL